MIDRIYKLVQTVSNNELNGNISPQEFNLELHNSVVEIYESTLFELNRAEFRQRRGRTKKFSLQDLSDKLRERVMHYYTTDLATWNEPTQNYILPDTVRYLEAIEYKGKTVEKMQDRGHYIAMQEFQDTKPTAECVICYQMGRFLAVSPNELREPLNIYFLRNPKFAKWTYHMVQNTPVFNPSHQNFQDVDIHPSEEYNLTVKLLQKLGINLKEQQLVEYGLRKENQDFQQENIS